MKMSFDNTTRRDLIRGAGALGVFSLAGCLGDDDGDDYTLVLGGSPSGTATFQAGQALARAANEHSDFLTISVQESSGWAAHPYEFEAGELSAFGIDNNTLAEAMNDEGGFADDPVSTLPMQGISFTTLDIYWVAVEGSDIESTADIAEGGYNIHPIQPGFGSRNISEKVIRQADIWDQNDIVNIDASDVAGAIEEGRIDALCVYGNNGIELAGWIQEVDIRNDGDIYAINVDDNFRQAIDDTSGATAIEIEPYGWQQDITRLTDTVVAWVLFGQWAFGPDIPARATYEVARLSAEHFDTIKEADPMALDLSDLDLMSGAIIPEIEVHPGVADYLEEHGAWNDDWTRGEADA